MVHMVMLVQLVELVALKKIISLTNREMKLTYSEDQRGDAWVHAHQLHFLTWLHLYTIICALKL